MGTLRYTLIGDGSSDKVLLNIIKWLLDDLYPELAIEGKFADFRYVRRPPKTDDVKNRILCAEEYYPFDILFYHRDAELIKNNIVQERIEEIKSELTEDYYLKVVCVVPVVMMESWLLFDTEAIKKAAANRNYSKEIQLPALKKIEAIKEPKSMLYDLLKEVSGLKSRNLRKFNVNKAVHLVAENIQDFSPLRQLTSFQNFEKDLKIAVEAYQKK